MIEAAAALLRNNASPLGLLGNSRAYQQVWARDSMICALGLLSIDGGAEIHARSLATLKRFQSRLGRIPHNVGYPGVHDPALIAEGMQDEPGGGPVEDTGHAGCIDSNLWYIFGHCLTGAPDESCEKAYLWLEYQDSNDCGLLEAHEAMDWADLFANRYNTLMANVLWYAVNRAMGYHERAEDIKFKVNTLLWRGPEFAPDLEWVKHNRKEWLYPIHLTQTLLVVRPYYLPYMGFRDYGDRFDTFGNLLAILTGLASEEQSERILDYIEGAGLAEPWPIRALDHPIHPGDKDWREYYRLRHLNQPDHYHNGGAWPFIGGFYVAALTRAGRHEEAERQLRRLTQMNSQDRQFNEWFHGKSGKPMGFGGQSWSAAMLLYADQCVRTRQCAGF